MLPQASSIKYLAISCAAVSFGHSKNFQPSGALWYESPASLGLYGEIGAVGVGSMHLGRAL
jgi:hypothetical protein